MKSAWTSAAILLGFAAPSIAMAQVRIAEIMYNPAQGEVLEYIEIENAGETPAAIGGWAFTNGVAFTFPEGLTLDAGAIVVVPASRDDFIAAYPDVPGEIVLEGYEGRLANGGERVTLSNAEGTIEDTLRYDDNPPWDFLADGFGASLERLCFDSAADAPENWRATEVPADPEVTFGGTPGRSRAEEICPPVFAAKPRVFFSEIHYHAVLEESLEDAHEFLEVHNAGDVPVDLAGWRIAAGVEFSFPDGATLAAGAYAVIAKDPEKLAAVEGFEHLADAPLFGPYERTLDNGGEKIALVSAAGQGIDSVNYDDEAPWPVGADALGAGASWLREELLPLESHRHKGHSLERVSFDVPSGVVANWAPSPLDGMTPGRANASARTELLPIVDDIDLVVVGSEDRFIRANEVVRVEVEFAPRAPSAAVLDYFVEDVAADDERVNEVPLVVDGERWVAEIPGHLDNTIIRYRVRADTGGGLELVSPRPTDPNGWYAYFVMPVIETETRTYHVFISPANWTQLNRNISPHSRVSGCALNPRWNARERAIVVQGRQVSDALVRYQGSRWNRGNGPQISWRHPGPSGGVRALSWRVQVPRYAEIDGRGVMVFNKLTQGCPGHNAGVGYRLFAAADIPSPRTRYARLHINGGYYHYAMEYERPGEEMIRRHNREMAEKYPDRPDEDVGHLFKSVGCTCDEGPYGWGDWRRLGVFCQHPREVRYAATYDRKTHGWADNAELIELIEGMHRARAEGIDAMRDFILANFDFELLMDYIAIINYSVPFDDMFQNHFIYQRTSDGKWLLMPWDLDRNFGEWQGANSSFLMGRQGDPSNRSGWWHRLKDTFLRAFEDEYHERLLFLNNTILHPDRIAELVAQVTAEASQEEANQSPARLQCGTFASRAATFNSFAITRHNLINSRLAGVDVEAGRDQTVFVGETVQFDASESEPAPGPEIDYTWSNGMVGATPTFVFEEAGTYEIELTITKGNIPFTDSVTIEVLAVPPTAFAERDASVVIEGESYFQILRRDREDTWWVDSTEVEGFSGNGYVHAFEERRRTFSSGYSTTAPELRYAIEFTTAGTYFVWVRGFVPSTRTDTVNLNLGGVERSSRAATDFEVDEENYIWSGIDRDENPQTVVVAEPGLEMLSIWIRESGFSLDKVVLTQDETFVPEGLGPDESQQVPTGGEAATFVRGDVNADERINVTDAIAILLHLFAGKGSVACADHGDIDDDGSLAINDAIRLLTYLFQRGAPPAAPFPNPGLDPTADANDCGDR